MLSQLILGAAIAATTSAMTIPPGSIPPWVTSSVPPPTATPFVPPHSPNFQSSNNRTGGASGGSANKEFAILATGGVVTTGAGSDNAGNIDDGVGDGVDSYTLYQGDGTTGQGWPAQSRWVSFENMFNNYKAQMFSSCQNQFGVPNDQNEEVGQLFNAIQSAAFQTRVDHRFILAVVMQESSGCVRVPPSQGFFRNPGLMQSANGQSECNDGNGNVQTPCPTGTIFGMITDGTAGTPDGDGLAQCMNRAGTSDVSDFYKAARLYNSGSIPSNGDLSGPGATRCYASDIANRLTGWVNAPHGCNL